MSTKINPLLVGKINIQAQNNTGLVGQWSLGTADYANPIVYGKGISDQLTAVASPTLTTGFDGRANQALAFNGTTQYLTQKIYLSNSATANQLMLSTANGQAFLQHFTTNFSAYAAPSLADKPYMAVVKDTGLDVAWAYSGEAGTDTLGAELLTNGDFETGDPPSAWSTNGGSILDGVADPCPAGGAQACEVTRGTTFTVASQVRTTVPGQMYKITGWVKNVDATSGYCEFYQMGMQQVSSTAWTFITGYFIASTTLAEIILRINGVAGQKCRFDNVSLKAVTESLGAELVTNGDMELDANWSNWGSPTVNERSDVQKHAGSYSRHVVTDATSEGIQSVSFPIINGALYKFSCWVYLVSGSVNIDPSDSDFSVAYAGTATTGAWKFLYFYATAIRDNAAAIIKIWNGSSAVSEFYVDDVSIKGVTAPVATGLKLYSTKTGSVQNMAGTAAAFGPNEALTYEVRKTDFQITEAITVGAWVKGAAQAVKTIIGKCDYGLSQYSYLIRSGSANNTKLLVLLADNNGLERKNYESSEVCFNDVWHFVLFTYDGNNTLRIFINGVEDTQINKIVDVAMTNIHDIFVPLLVGANLSNHAVAGQFNGKIAHTFIYNRALSAVEVLGLYNSQKKFFIN